MTFKVEGVVNRTVHAEEALGGPSRLEPLQLGLASSDCLTRILRPIVFRPRIFAMPAPKGIRPPNAGKGRPKGATNAMTRTLREMILGALDDAGGQDYLVEQAHKNPAAFLALIGRVLSREPQVEVPKHITLNFGPPCGRRGPPSNTPSIRWRTPRRSCCRCAIRSKLPGALVGLR